MRTSLDKALRGKLEKTVEKARDIVEIAVAEALTRLGISDGSAPSYLSDEERKLRNRLRSHGRQLGDALNKESGKQETELLINEMSYEHWHRMLFARFLEQSNLLMYEPGTPVSLQDCVDLAEEEPDIKDGWELAGRLAQKMLPQIFRADSPVFEVKLSINHVNALEELIAALDKATFQASDSLGWCYQFWQNKKKKQVNESGVKIGAKELSPVTQLFTEPYMVSFLLDNALGAWWAKRRLSQDDLLTATSEQELRELAAIPGVPLEYLRFTKAENKDEEGAHSPEKAAWSCAAGDFDKWPEHLSELKTLDPCCGSGHFLVAKFLMLVPMRMELEALTAKQAIDKVIAENIHGLELDQRCVELAAFALALEAWRYPGAGGYRQLPELQLACSGVSITEAQKEWKDLAKDDEELQGAIKWMQDTFRDAPTLGSLIEPTSKLKSNQKSPLEVLQQAISLKSNISQEANAIAQGLSKTAEMLSERYQWVVTNVPFLGIRKQNSLLTHYLEKKYFGARHDLAMSMMQRIFKLLTNSGTFSVVSPQTWQYQSSYKEFREFLYNNSNILGTVRLGSEAFETISGQVVTVCLTCFSRLNVTNNSSYFALDLSGQKIEQKQELLKDKVVGFVKLPKNNKLGNELNIETVNQSQTLDNYSIPNAGMATGDSPRFYKNIWELPVNSDWEFILYSVDSTEIFSGRTTMILWEQGNGSLKGFVDSMKHLNSAAQRWKTGHNALGRKGVAISRMGKISTSIYNGEFFDQNCAVLLPKSLHNLSAIASYCLDPAYSESLRKANPNLAISSSTVAKANFDENEWRETACLLYPNSLPKPYSNTPTQWVFHGHPCSSVIWSEDNKNTAISKLRQDDTVLQVAVARLLGYRWPAELDAEMELASEMREIIATNKVFDDLIDDDGIVCIPAIRGEKPAIDRLEAILHAAYGDKWSATILNNLLKSVKSRDLNLWLRDKFFEQHSKLFQHRPFIWQIWDGLPDGFSALVNYHMLDYKGLERLIYTYLDDWISTQIQQEKDGDEGAELRLTAARNLREQLEAILVGEKGMDIFVRWKSPAEQPIGWNPDLNDGVRLNIRPFMQAKDVGKKDAGILRSKPNIHWKKDRGTDVESAPWFDLGLKYGGKQGDRINDHHLTLAEKKAGRENS